MRRTELGWVRWIGAVIGATAAVGVGSTPAGAQETPVVSDGGPYGAVDVGSPLTLQGAISGFSGEVEIEWVLDDPAAPCSLEDADTLTPTITCDGAVEVGIELTVTDMSDGQAYSDSTMVRYEDPYPRLDIDAGGPYIGVVGEPIELHGIVRGIEGDFRVGWSEDAEGIPCTFGNETSLDATITCHEPISVGIAMGVEELATGILDYDIAHISVRARPGGPGTTTTSTSGPTTTTAAPSSTTAPSTTSTTSASGATTTTTTTGRPGQLPRTGTATGQLAVTGVLLVGGGAVLVQIARRRTRQGA